MQECSAWKVHCERLEAQIAVLRAENARLTRQNESQNARLIELGREYTNVTKRNLVPVIQSALDRRYNNASKRVRRLLDPSARGKHQHKEMPDDVLDDVLQELEDMRMVVHIIQHQQQHHDVLNKSATTPPE